MNTANEQVSEWIVEGMTCSNCAMGVRKRLEKQGMENVDVNFATGDVRFENIPGKPLAEIKESIEELGYTVAKASEPSEKKKD
ncbi:MAG: heavy-metal-associated domain-containing protein [Bacteroidia bacterium]|jgi:P-type Cu+ transporter|nr:heavy-metal-associated domain-containing protein [Bacteroidia bacterium]